MLYLNAVRVRFWSIAVPRPSARVESWPAGLAHLPGLGQGDRPEPKWQQRAALSLLDINTSSFDPRFRLSGALVSVPSAVPRPSARMREKIYRWVLIGNRNEPKF